MEQSSNELPVTGINHNFMSPLRTVTPLSKYVAAIVFVLMPFIGGIVGYVYAPEKSIEMPIVQKITEVQHVKVGGLEESRAGMASQYIFASIAKSADKRLEYLVRLPYEGANLSALFYEEEKSVPDTSPYSSVRGIYPVSPKIDSQIWINPQQYDPYRNATGTVNWLVSTDSQMLLTTSPTSQQTLSLCTGGGMGGWTAIGETLYAVELDTASVRVLKSEYIRTDASYQIIRFVDATHVEVLRQVHKPGFFTDSTTACAGEVISEEKVIFDIDSDFFL